MTVQLKCTNLGFSVRNKCIVSNVNIEVTQKEIVGIFGPNGAGKTTTFQMIAGIIPSTTGKMIFDNHEITSLSLAQRANLGLFYLPQDSSVFREFSVKDNLMAALECRKDLTHLQKISKADELLDLIKLTKIADSLGKSISGGERRRVEIARLLALSPKMIMLDEPFAGVDPVAVGDIKDIIEKMAEAGVGVIITDHNVRETLRLCHRGYVLHNGSVITSGGPEAIMSCPKVTKVYLGDTFADVIN